MKTIILSMVIPAIGGTGVHVHADTQELQIVRSLIMRDQEGATPDVLQVRLWVKNVGEKEITVLTRNLKFTLLNYDDRPKELSINLSTQMNIDGADVIPSLYDFSPVRLHPGEVAEIQLEYRDRKNLEEVIVIYDMRNRIARRFNAWDGIVRGELVEVIEVKRNR